MIRNTAKWSTWITLFSNVSALLIGVITIAIMTGWITHNNVLIHLFLPLAAMQFNTALCFFLYSVSILGLRVAPKLSFTTSFFAALIALTTLCQYVFSNSIGIDTLFVIPFNIDYNIHSPGRMADSTALGLLLLGVALILSIQSGRLTYYRALTIILLSTVITTTGAVPLLGHVFTLKSAYEGGHIHMSVYAALFFISYGITLAAYASDKAESFQNWLPIPIFICITFVTYTLSQAIQQQEEANFDAMMQAEVNHISREADFHLANFYHALDRIASRWDAAGGTPRNLWESDAKAYIHDYPFLAALSKTDTDARIQWIIPESKDNNRAMGFQITSEPRRAEAANRAIATHEGQATKFLELLGGGNGYLYIMPIYNAEHYDGLIIAVMRVQQIFEEILNHQNLHDFYITVGEEKVIFSTLPEGQIHSQRWQKSGIIHNKNAEWTVTISPTPQLLTTKNSLIPLILMVGGILIASLVTFSIIFMLKWRHNAKALRFRELALEESIALNNAILAGAAHLIIATDTHGTTLLFNKQAEQSLGYSADEIIGKHTPALWHSPQEILDRAQELTRELGEEVKPGIDVFIKKIIEGGAEKHEWTFIRKDGSTFPGELTASALKDSNMQIVGFLGIIQDISERKEIERIKNEFISTVSHELRTPLTSIRGSLGLLLGGVGGALADKSKNLVDIAYKNCERLVLLINDILDLEKIEAGQMHFDIKLENLTDLVEQAITLNQNYGEKYNVRFVLKDSLSNANVYIDSSRLLQVMGNLISNAAKFSPAGSEVELSVTQDGSAYRVSVIDTGGGIPEEFKPRIFQKFAQADSSDSRQKGGSGLGLTISRTIIEHMGGTIGFISQAGKGTTFYFDLPQASQADETPIMLARKSNKRPRILICEDDPDIAHLLHITLDKEGYDSDIAYTAAMALEFLKGLEIYTAMTLDIMLPDKDGLTFLYELHEKESTKQLPIIIVSAKAAEVAGTLKGRAIGVVDCLSKPIDTSRLIKAIRSIEPKTECSYILHVEDDEDTTTVLALALKNVATLIPATSIKEARRLMQERAFDLIILDLALPDGNGLDVLTILQQNGSSVPVIVFSANEIPDEISAKVEASLTKSKTSSEHVITTITTLISKMSKQA